MCAALFNDKVKVSRHVVTSESLQMLNFLHSHTNKALHSTTGASWDLGHFVQHFSVGEK